MAEQKGACDGWYINTGAWFCENCGQHWASREHQCESARTLTCPICRRPAALRGDHIECGEHGRYTLDGEFYVSKRVAALPCYHGDGQEHDMECLPW